MAGVESEGVEAGRLLRHKGGPVRRVWEGPGVVSAEAGQAQT